MKLNVLIKKIFINNFFIVNPNSRHIFPYSIICLLSGPGIVFLLYVSSNHKFLNLGGSFVDLSYPLIMLRVIGHGLRIDSFNAFL